jgi:hypothetical protein
MAPKANPAEPNIRDALTTKFIEELARDFAEHGKEIVEQVRKDAPAKYAELVLRLIPLEPRMVESENPQPKNSREIAEHLLRDVGIFEPSNADCDAALVAYDTLIAALEDIAKRALH